MKVGSDNLPDGGQVCGEQFGMLVQGCEYLNALAVLPAFPPWLNIANMERFKTFLLLAGHHYKQAATRCSM